MEGHEHRHAAPGDLRAPSRVGHAAAARVDFDLAADARRHWQATAADPGKLAPSAVSSLRSWVASQADVHVINKPIRAAV